MSLWLPRKFNYRDFALTHSFHIQSRYSNVKKIREPTEVYSQSSVSDHIILLWWPSFWLSLKHPKWCILQVYIEGNIFSQQRYDVLLLTGASHFYLCFYFDILRLFLNGWFTLWAEQLTHLHLYGQSSGSSHTSREFAALKLQPLFPQYDLIGGDIMAVHINAPLLLGDKQSGATKVEVCAKRHAVLHLTSPHLTVCLEPVLVVVWHQKWGLISFTIDFPLIRFWAKEISWFKERLKTGLNYA